MNRTKIEWCDWTWNPIVGCSPVSAGCANCYAAAISKRFGLPWGAPHFMPHRLAEPEKVSKPGRVFVCSMSDFGGASNVAQSAVGKAMNAAPWHTYIILTKRPETLCIEHLPRSAWVGVTAENQESANDRWNTLVRRADVLGGPSVLFVSAEPMLGPVTFAKFDHKPDWVIAGPETGPKARPCRDEWILALARESLCFFDKRKVEGVRREWPAGQG